jgi:hypothetical protein
MLPWVLPRELSISEVTVVEVGAAEAPLTFAPNVRIDVAPKI